MTVVTLTMTIGLYRYKKDLGDKTFNLALIGFGLLTAGQVMHTFHAIYHIFRPVMYSPSLRVAVSGLELAGYTTVFWALQNYFRRFGDL